MRNYKSKNIWKIIFNISWIIAFFALIAFGLTFIFSNWNIDNNNLYLEEDLNNQHMIGYEQALANKQSYIAQLKEEKAKLQEVSVRLNNLKQQYENSNYDNEQYKNEIEQLQISIEKTSAQILEYELLIEQLEQESKMVITFVVEDEETVVIVEKYSYAENMIPNLPSNAVFNGWLFNGEIIDLTKQPVITDMILIADIDYYYNITIDNVNKYYVKDLSELLNNGVLAPGTEVSYPKIIKGYALASGEVIVDFNNYELNEDLSLTTTYTVTPIKDTLGTTIWLESNCIFGLDRAYRDYITKDIEFPQAYLNFTYNNKTYNHWVDTENDIKFSSTNYYNTAFATYICEIDEETGLKLLITFKDYTNTQGYTDFVVYFDLYIQDSDSIPTSSSVIINDEITSSSIGNLRFEFNYKI